MAAAPYVNPKILNHARRLNPNTDIIWDGLINRWVWAGVAKNRSGLPTRDDIMVLETKDGRYRPPDTSDLRFIHLHTVIGRHTNFKNMRRLQMATRERYIKKLQELLVSEAVYEGGEVGKYLAHRRHGVYLG